jgi:hypothetical protein
METKRYLSYVHHRLLLMIKKFKSGRKQMMLVSNTTTNMLYKFSIMKLRLPKAKLAMVLLIFISRNVELDQS